MKIKDLRSSHWFRSPVWVAALIVAAIGFLAGSVSRQLQVRRDLHRTQEAVVQKHELLAQWHEDFQRVATDGLEDRFQTFRSYLPEDAAGVRRWLSEVQCLAANHSLLVSPTWGDAEVLSGSVGRFERIQVTLELRPERDVVGNARTAAVIRWLRDLGLDQPPLELHRVQFSGTNQGLALALVTGRLWVRTLEPSDP